MKKNIISVILLSAAAILSLASCNREQMEPASPAQGMRVFTASLSDDVTRASINGCKLSWKEGDQIAIIDTAGHVAIYGASAAGSTADFTFISGEAIEGPVEAYYPASAVSGTVMYLPKVQKYNADGDLSDINPMYAPSTEGTELSFKNMCALVELTLKGTATVKSIVLKDPSRHMAGAVTARTELEGDLIEDDMYEALTATKYCYPATLDCGEGVALTAEGTKFYMAIPTQKYAALSIIITDTEGNIFKKTAKEDVYAYRNTIYALELTPAFKKDLQGALDGLFSINATDKVRFSQGNLQYNAAQNVFRFAENQFDSVTGAAYNVEGGDNTKASATYDGWIDMFGWGSSGYSDAKPYTTDTKCTGYGPQEVGVDISGTEYDWGIYNKISNGGNQAGLWTVLTGDELDYILNKRPVDNRFMKAYISGTQFGLFLFPDDYVHPAEAAALVNVNGASSPHNQGVYSFEDFAKMEAAGAVFLPVNGYRNPNGSMSGRTSECYWLGSATNTSNYKFAVTMYARDASILITTNDYWQRYYGCGVRLVENIYAE